MDLAEGRDSADVVICFDFPAVLHSEDDSPYEGDVPTVGVLTLVVVSVCVAML